MSLITTVEHGLASGLHDLKVAAKYVETKVLPALQAEQTHAAVIDGIAQASGIPFVQAADRVGESLIGWAINFIEAAEKAGTDPAGTLGVLVADVKAIAPTVKAAAAPVSSLKVA